MTFKLLSLLLRHPDDDILAARDDIARAVGSLPPSPVKLPMLRFLDFWAEEPAQRLRIRYADTFDFSKRGNLYLSYYRYGDARVRGQALAETKEAYLRAGFEPATTELPDYLPLMLEFAWAEPEAGERLLAQHRGDVELIRKSLHGDGSPYALLLDALVAVLPELDESEVDELRKVVMHGPPQETVGLEPYGAEEPLSRPSPNVTFLGRKR